MGYWDAKGHVVAEYTYGASGKPYADVVIYTTSFKASLDRNSKHGKYRGTSAARNGIMYQH